jgi:hypothetical protein
MNCNGLSQDVEQERSAGKEMAQVQEIHITDWNGTSLLISRQP